MLRFIEQHLCDGDDEAYLEMAAEVTPSCRSAHHCHRCPQRASALAHGLLE